MFTAIFINNLLLEKALKHKLVESLSLSANYAGVTPAKVTITELFLDGSQKKAVQREQIVYLFLANAKVQPSPSWEHAVLAEKTVKTFLSEGALLG